MTEIPIAVQLLTGCTAALILLGLVIVIGIRSGGGR